MFFWGEKNRHALPVAIPKILFRSASMVARQFFRLACHVYPAGNGAKGLGREGRAPAGPENGIHSTDGRWKNTNVELEEFTTSPDKLEFAITAMALRC